MNKKALAIAGIVAGMLLSGCSASQSKPATQSETAMAPKDLFMNNCSACHGGNLQGGYGPSLQKIGSKLSKDQILHVIQNGQGAMPPQNQMPKEAQEKLAAWLTQNK
jgi:cytochrome c551